MLFVYGNYEWEGAIPRVLEKQGLQILDENQFKKFARKAYDVLNPKNRSKWIQACENYWENKHKGQTYAVLVALQSGEWECRVCGPLPKTNPQDAARLSALKSEGYVIASQRRFCTQCKKSTMHDLLVMLPTIRGRFGYGKKLRAPMSEKLKTKTKETLNHTETCFNVKRLGKQLVIDHKFPSQRWTKPESRNPDSMSVDDIRNKFQLLDNQTNMWKSRYCDRCVKENRRGDFMGIKWYYKGDENWRGAPKDNEEGCLGCPWYDLKEWKRQLTNCMKSK